MQSSIHFDVRAVELGLSFCERLHLAFLDLRVGEVHRAGDGVAAQFEFADAAVGDGEAAYRVALDLVLPSIWRCCVSSQEASTMGKLQFRMTADLFKGTALHSLACNGRPGPRLTFSVIWVPKLVRSSKTC